MRLACADFTFPLLEHDKALQLVRDLGFAGVDIGLFEERSHLWPSQVLKNAKSSAENLRRQLEDLDLAVADIFLHAATDLYSRALNHPDQKQRKISRDWYKRTLEWTVLVGCNHLTELPGMPWKSESRKQSYERSAAEIAWRTQEARAVGVTFSVEPHGGSILSTPKQVMTLLGEVSEATLTLDYSHFISAGLPAEDVHPLLSATRHFHARGARRGRFQAKVAENTIDFPDIVRRLHAQSYSGWVELEYVWMQGNHGDEVDNLSETILLKRQIESALKAKSQKK